MRAAQSLAGSVLQPLRSATRSSFRAAAIRGIGPNRHVATGGERASVQVRGGAPYRRGSPLLCARSPDCARRSAPDAWFGATAHGSSGPEGPEAVVRARIIGARIIGALYRFTGGSHHDPGVAWNTVFSGRSSAGGRGASAGAGAA